MTDIRKIFQKIVDIGRVREWSTSNIGLKTQEITKNTID